MLCYFQGVLVAQLEVQYTRCGAETNKAKLRQQQGRLYDADFAFAPVKRLQRGRPKLKRRRNQLEESRQRHQPHVCSLCGGPHHNERTCRQALTTTNSGQTTTLRRATQ